MSSVISSDAASAQALLEQPAWNDALKAYIEADWQEVVAGEFARGVKYGTWSVQAMRGWILQLYPFIHSFPKFLAEALIKVEDEYSRSFLIDNIRVEKAHAEHWVWMGEGFGIPRAEIMALAEGERPVLRDVQSLTDWIWYINAKGSLAEAVAATSFAIEGATGDMARALLEGFTAYGSRPEVNMSPRTSKWLRTHAKYDDEHPVIALQVVTQYARTERERRKCMAAARRSLQLLSNALLISARHYSESGRADTTQRVERRSAQRPIAFPDRRVRDRGAAAKVA